MVGTFSLEGQEFMVLNGGPHYKLTPAFSLMVNCETQEEVDYYWDKLTEGGTEVQCGWLTDKFGVSWQIVPKMFMELMRKGERGADEPHDAGAVSHEEADHCRPAKGV